MLNRFLCCELALIYLGLFHLIFNYLNNVNKIKSLYKISIFTKNFIFLCNSIQAKMSVNLFSKQRRFYIKWVGICMKMGRFLYDIIKNR